MNLADYVKRRLFSRRITMLALIRVVKYCKMSGDAALLFRWDKTNQDMKLYFIEDKDLPLSDDSLSIKESIKESSNGGKHVLGN